MGGALVLTGDARGRAEFPHAAGDSFLLIPLAAVSGPLITVIAIFIVASTLGLAVPSCAAARSRCCAPSAQRPVSYGAWCSARPSWSRSLPYVLACSRPRRPDGNCSPRWPTTASSPGA